MTNKTFKEIASELGLDLDNKNVPVQKKIWYAYLDGKAIACSSLEEAKKYKFYEAILDPDTKKAIQEHWAGRNVLETKAAEIFHDQLRELYADVPDKLFEMCYVAARDRRKSSTDYEEIPQNLKYFVEFAQMSFNLMTNPDYEEVSSDKDVDYPEFSEDVSTVDKSEIS